jgi:Domain of unknown function (DUF4331)
VSDHFSGPRAIAGPAGDICDLYAFPSPEQPGRLVLVMNVLPRADPSACFSDAIVCRFRLRPVSMDGESFSVGPEETELVFDCSFDEQQHGRCAPPHGEPFAFELNDQHGASADGVRVFAGLRSDPFFLDLRALQESMTRGRLAFTQPGRNSLAGFNVLSIVIETQLAPGASLYAVVGETVSAGKLPIRLERVGRPEIKNVILSWKEYDAINRDLEVRDLYNLEDAFHLGGDYRGVYRSRLDANLAAFDRLDGKTDWPLDANGAHPLTELLLADHLVVDISKPYAEDTFFEIERSRLAGRPNATCGGRSLNDDVMDTLLTLLIASDSPRVRDGVDTATTPAGREFPYLAKPNAIGKGPRT